jgi:hypothetical protein
MKLFDNPVHAPTIQFQYPTSMFSVYVYLQGQNEDMGFVGDTSNMVYVSLVLTHVKCVDLKCMVKIVLELASTTFSHDF